MDWKKSKSLLWKLAVFYWLLAVLIYVISYDQFRYQTVTSDTFSPAFHIGEVTDGTEVAQRLVIPAERLDSVGIVAGTFARTNSGRMILSMLNDKGETVAQAAVDVSELADGVYTAVPLDPPLEGCRGQAMKLLITTEGCEPGSAVTLYAGNMISTGRVDITQQIDEEDLFILDGVTGAGALCVELTGANMLQAYRMYWIVVGAAFALMALYTLLAWKQAHRGKANALALVLNVYCRYGFMIHQLVSRDFKTKYKRSVLGMFWSFLNPLLTMLVQYAVFSTLFRSNIPNYSVYLITGIVFFNFFSEAVTMGMTAITGNAALIKKVYMPKYIYPISKILSSLINFALALIPMLLIILCTGTPIRPSMLLLIFDILCLVGFAMGMALLLSTATTFFQDMVFLWGVISMMWMYMTPIFYPESIIPQRMIRFYHMNPLYQFVTFARTCIIDGISPAPMSYVWTLLSAGVVLVIGLWVFKRHQDKFVLYL